AEFSADDRVLVTREEDFLRIWDLQESVQRQRLRVGEFGERGIAIRPDNSVLIGNGNRIELLRPGVAKREEFKEFTHGALLAISWTGRLAIVGGWRWKKNATLVDVSTGTELWSPEIAGPAISALFSPDERFLLLRTGLFEVSLWDLKSRRCVHRSIGKIDES